MRDGEVFGGLVRIGSNPSGSRPNFFGDSTSPLTRDGHGCPKLNVQSFARMRNQQSVHMARVIVLFEDSAVLQWLWERKGSVQREGQARQGHCAERGVIVFLRWLWGWRGLVQREERAPPLRKARGIVRFWKGWCKRRMVVRQSLRLDGKKFDKSKRWTYRKQNATKRQFVPCRQSTSL